MHARTRPGGPRQMHNMHGHNLGEHVVAGVEAEVVAQAHKRHALQLALAVSSVLITPSLYRCLCISTHLSTPAHTTTHHTRSRSDEAHQRRRVAGEQQPDIRKLRVVGAAAAVRPFLHLRCHKLRHAHEHDNTTNTMRRLYHQTQNDEHSGSSSLPYC